MRAVALLTAILLCTAPLAGQETGTDQLEGAFSTAVVPVVGDLFGVGMARWKTDVEIVNDTGVPVDVAIELPLAPESPAIFLSLAPGQVQRFGDLISDAFGLETAISPLRVTTGARRSVSVNTNVYAVLGGKVSPRQPIPLDLGSSFYPMRILDGLNFSDDYRTNIGLVNLAERDADFTLAVERIPGRVLAVSYVRVAPGTMKHEAIQALFPMITKGAGFSLIVETQAPDTFVYGSVIENATNAGRFVSARVGARQ